MKIKLLFQSDKANNIKLILLILVVLLFLSGCKERLRGPFSTDNVFDMNIYLPIYQLDPNSVYADIGVTYYYLDYAPELDLFIYFTRNHPENGVVRVAEMIISSLGGPPLAADGVTTLLTPTTVSVTLARAGTTSACPLSSISDQADDRFTGPPFQSCLFWYDEEMNIYSLYTIWPEEDAANFANSLRLLEEE